MKVKTEYTECKYLTAEKVYDVKNKDLLPLFLIIGDNGCDTWCLLYGCGHINNNNWIIVEE